MIFALEKDEDREAFISLSTKFISELETIEIKKINKKRTLSQNSYLHVLMTLFGVEFGYSLEEAKTMLKRQCPFMRYEKKGQWFLKRTSEMTTSEISEFIDWIFVYSSKNGLVLPTIEEYKSNPSQYQRVIDSNKEFI